MRGLQGKTAIITGGAVGLGEAIALRLSEEGCVVYLLDINEEGHQTAERIQRQTGISTHFIQIDLSKDESIADAFGKIQSQRQEAHILVNNAAHFVFKSTDATDEDWDRILDVNVKGTSKVTHHCIPLMKRAGGGSIINLSSVSGFVGQANFATYNATKFAIRGLTKCWAVDLAPYNIRVNTICPGYIWTKAFENSCNELGLDIEKENERASALHILGRQGKPEEVAGPVALLASDDASFMTGTDVLVDGGYLAL